jgi:ubiquitin carboxyl-terminal hydrolase 4/11
MYSYLSRYTPFAETTYRVNEPTSSDKLVEGVSIYDCFRQFNRPEKLSQANAWYCNRCVGHKQAVKKIQIFNTPPVLIINLKRFRGSYAKQNTLVDFPIEGLDMSEFVVSKDKPPHRPIYDLFAVSNHYG